MTPVDAGKLLAGGLGLKSRFVGMDGQECTVEGLALQYYASEAGGCWQGTCWTFQCFAFEQHEESFSDADKIE